MAELFPDGKSPGLLALRVSLSWPRVQQWLLAMLALSLVIAVGATLHGLLHEVRYTHVMSAVGATSSANLMLAVMATGASYLALTGYDVSSLVYARAHVARPTVLLTSFVAYALSNTIGLGPLTGAAIRLRMYAAAGLEPPRIAQAIAFNSVALGVGMTALAAVGFLLDAYDLAPLMHVRAALLRDAAGALLLLLGAFFYLCARHRTLCFGRWTISLPLPGLAFQQLVISALELGASATVLWVLLPDHRFPLPTFVTFYAVAVVAGFVSQVPGGLGVFEAVMLVLAKGEHMPIEQMLGALLLYRGIYYVLPLVIATGLLAAYELRTGVAAPLSKMAVHLSPRLMAALALVAGGWLLVSGATPLTEDAREILFTLRVPLPLIEASHFLGSVAGIGLLLVARGLFHRLDAAWWAALALSIVAAVLAVPKGIAVNEAALLLTLAGLLLISRRQFNRRSSFFAQRFELEWLLALTGVIVACVWVLFFAYQEVAYSNHLWWQFELDAQAPRSLRALMGAALVALAFGSWQLLRPPAGELTQPTAAEIERAGAMVRAGTNSDACYALIGDKHFLFSPSGASFLMFGKHGRSWVSLYGPLGDQREWPDLVWNFVELAAAHGGRAAFYQVAPAMLPLYLDCGLQAFKLGEDAQVSLPEFNLKGGKRANLRSGMNRGEREGLSFEVIEASQVAPLLPELRCVSDAWLAQQQAREKSFSVGRFDDSYLQRLPLAIVKKDDRIVAFANLLVTDVKDKASVDLMRYLPDAPSGTMDFLFAKLLLHLQAEGYRRFGLGMSPMAGMAEQRSAPRWQRLGKLLFDYGERFYNFRGLRSFKEKFEPVWEARYLAAPRGLAPLLVLMDVASLIGGGARGVISK